MPKQIKPSANKAQRTWIDELPPHWGSKRLKFCLATPLSYGANESAEGLSTTDPRFIRITDLAEDGSLRPDTFSRPLKRPIAVEL